MPGIFLACSDCRQRAEGVLQAVGFILGGNLETPAEEFREYPIE